MDGARLSLFCSRRGSKFARSKSNKGLRDDGHGRQITPLPSTKQWDVDANSPDKHAVSSQRSAVLNRLRGGRRRFSSSPLLAVVSSSTSRCIRSLLSNQNQPLEKGNGRICWVGWRKLNNHTSPSRREAYQLLVHATTKYGRTER